jgi:DNA-directed RNA polymerase subunit M/transcription elongation factor TFIIS
MLKEIEKQIGAIKPIRRKRVAEQQRKEEKDEFTEFLKREFTEHQIKRLEKYNPRDRYEIIGLVFELIEDYKKDSNEEIPKKELIDKALDEIESTEDYLFDNRFMKRERDKLVINLKISRKRIVLKEESMYKCPKCGSNKIFTTQLQMRRADEPMTTFFRCTICNYQWRG